MIPLKPNTTYKIRYTKGKTYNEGDTAYFQTLDHVPEAKHLIRVKNLHTGQIVDLVEMLAHPWDQLDEYNTSATGSFFKDPGILRAIIPFLIHLILPRQAFFR